MIPCLFYFFQPGAAVGNHSQHPAFMIYGIQNKNGKEQKNMKQLQKQKENKAAIIEDMLSCITYIPNREMDILAFMEQYQKSDSEHRPAVLECLRDCMDGRKYPNPYESVYRYTAEDVADFEKILDEYTENLSAAQGVQAAIESCVQEAVCKINSLNEQCCQMLMDTWRRERVCGFINSAAEKAGLVPETDHTLQHRMW